MCLKKIIRSGLLGLAALPLLLTGNASWSQGVQVRSEAAVLASDAAQDDKDSVIVPDLEDELMNAAYTNWVSPAAGRQFALIDFLPKGGLLVQDGSVYREFDSSGDEVIGDIFPFPCEGVEVEVPKGQGTKLTTMDTCNAAVVTNSNTMRIFGTDKGKGLFLVALDLNDPDLCDDSSGSRICTGHRTADDTPPLIVDAVIDEGDHALEHRLGPRIYFVGNRKSVFSTNISSDITVLDSEGNIGTVNTWNGRKISSLALMGENVIIAFQNGEMRSYNLTTGADNFFYQHPICGGKKTPQRFSVRTDPDEVVALALNRACGTLTPLLADGTIADLDGDMTAMPFLFDNDGDGNAEVLGEAVVSRAGASGDFADCTTVACQLGQQENQATQEGTQLLAALADTGYRIFQSFIGDCRWNGIRPCPIVNCPIADTYSGMVNLALEQGAGCPDKEGQVLNLMEMIKRSDATGEIDALLPVPNPVLTIPANIRGEEEYRGTDGSQVPNPLNEFYTLFAFTDAIIVDTFSFIVNPDLFRPADDPGMGVIGSDDSCEVVGPATVEEVNDRATLVVHNRDSDNTIARGFPDDVGTDQKGGTVYNSFCGSNGAFGFRWSAMSTGLEFYFDSPSDYIDFTATQMAELQQAKDELLCPDGVSPRTVEDQGECNTLQGHLDQLASKLDTCHNALLFPQGGSQENCNAFFTHVTNTQAFLPSITGPDPADTSSANLALLRANYLGEFDSRLSALEFAVSQWLLNLDFGP